MSAARFDGPTLDAALHRAASELGCSHQELAYRVVEEGAGTMVVEAEIDPHAVLGLFLVGAFAAGRLDIRTELDHGDDILLGELVGADAGLLTRGGGEALDALQYLCNRVLDAKLGRHPVVRLDSGGFKDRRRLRLIERAVAEAERAVASGRPVQLEPMTPAARREVHMALAEDPLVETNSHGTGFLKRVVIKPRRR